MRNLKKVLSLVLCVAMMLSVMVMSTGATSFTDQEDFSENYAEAAEVLTGMGVINGYEDDSFKPQQSITRAEVAAMIYRVATGDVDDEKADINAGAKLFTDVNADDWFAGYVNYCGDAEYIKGYEDDSFRASNNVTGYEVLAMILRAVGYDKNKEFTGPTWTINVASTATELGMLENLDNSVNLAEPATREVVAELIFRAIVPGVPTVNYVPAIGDYLPDTWGHSLGEQVFKLELDPNTTDDWGRPNDTWKYNTGDEKTVIEEEALAVYTTAVVQCDVADETGVSGNDIPAVVNGQKTTVDINENATKATIGEQGRLTEVYEDCVVMIDTFLAQVTDVEAARYDANGHLATEATLTLSVYDADNPTSVELENGSTDWTYAVGDMLLVNAYTALDTGKVFNTGEAKQVGDEAQYVEIVSAAESFVGAQTTIHYNAFTHTINGTEYNDAYKFFRDDAGTREDYNLNWWLDQYGNVIGATAIADNYAVLKDMIWIDGRPGYAEATLVYMDGTEATVTVDSIDGNYRNDETHFGWWTNNDTTPALNDAQWVGFFGDNANVSSNSNYNGLYEGYALYRVDTNSDGSVNLEGIESYVSDWLMVIHYVDNATLNANRTALTNNGRVVTQLSNDTAILVKNGDTYTACSRADLPTINWETAEVFYSDADNNGIAENVYVKSYSSITGDYIFPTSDAARIETTTWGVIVEGVYIDGELTEVATTKDIANQLINNKGKLFRITDWVVNHDTPAYGMLNGIELVNEDNDSITLLNWQVNYLEDVSDLKVEGGILYVDQNLAYDLTDTVEVVYQNEPYTMTLADAVAAIQKDKDAHGIWVEGDANGDAAIVYVGTRLNEDNTITVTPAEGVADGALIPDADDPDGQNYTYTINDKNDDGKLDLVVKMDATSQYATMVVTETTMGASTVISPNTDGTVTLPNVAKGDTYKVTVTTECNGQCAEPARAEWTITIDGWNIISEAIDQVAYAGTQNSLKKDVTAYYDYADAVADPVNINTVGYDYIRFYGDNEKVVTDDATNWPVKYMTFTNTDYACGWAGDFATAGKDMTNSDDNGASYQILDISKLDNGNVIVLRYTPQNEGGQYVYVAFEIEK